MSELNCPRCNRDISIKKYALIDCKCGAKLLIAIVNGKEELHDLTKEEEI